jgi:hypothetical protein
MVEWVRDMCPSCGNPRSVCSDPERENYPHRAVCYITADREVMIRRLREAYKEEPGRDRHPLDGVSVFVGPDDASDPDSDAFFKPTEG